LFQFVDGKIAARRFEVLCNGVCDAAVLTFFIMRTLSCNGCARATPADWRQLRNCLPEGPWMTKNWNLNWAMSR